uniref:Actin cross-linking n=1 Tax=Cannabis sativa TaxID=3483 RepID=A0A803QM38_CANSA
MEFFNKAKAVRLKSHLGKYLIADKDEETVRQTHNNGSSRRAWWTVELVEGKSHVIRLKSFNGKYLTASDDAFLLGMTGKKVLLREASSSNTASFEWEPRTEGFQQIKLKSGKGRKYLRANGGTPPWRNTVTYDVPYRTATQSWILWNVEAVGLDNNYDDVEVEEHLSMEEEEDIESVSCPRMVRLRSHHDKYLLADEDEESVVQDRNGLVRNATWSVELLEEANVLRLKSCYGKYLMASNMPFLLGMTGKKVIQNLPKRLDSSLEWEPIREGFQVRLKTRYGQFLRANTGLPPWRNSITHDIPHRTSTQDWILWDVDVIEIRVPSPFRPRPRSAPVEALHSPPTIEIASPRRNKKSSSFDFDSGLVMKGEGRMIYYRVSNKKEEIDDGEEELSFMFKGSGVEELKQRLKNDTGLNDVVICSHNPLNGQLYPLRLHLPPNNIDMHVVVVPSSSLSEVLK